MAVADNDSSLSAHLKDREIETVEVVQYQWSRLYIASFTGHYYSWQWSESGWSAVRNAPRIHRNVVDRLEHRLVESVSDG